MQKSTEKHTGNSKPTPATDYRFDAGALIRSRQFTEKEKYVLEAVLDQTQQYSMTQARKILEQEINKSVV